MSNVAGNVMLCLFQGEIVSYMGLLVLVLYWLSFLSSLPYSTGDGTATAPTSMPRIIKELSTQAQIIIFAYLIHTVFWPSPSFASPLQWLHNGRHGVSNHQSHECLLSRLIRRRSMKTSKLGVTGLCARNSPETGEFPTQRASNAENVSIDDVIMTRHHETSPAMYWAIAFSVTIL